MHGEDVLVVESVLQGLEAEVVIVVKAELTVVDFKVHRLFAEEDYGVLSEVVVFGVLEVLFGHFAKLRKLWVVGLRCCRHCEGNQKHKQQCSHGVFSFSRVGLDYN